MILEIEADTSNPTLRFVENPRWMDGASKGAKPSPQISDQLRKQRHYVVQTDDRPIEGEFKQQLTASHQAIALRQSDISDDLQFSKSLAP